MPNTPPVTDLLDAAVTALGGRRRDGQVAMASAVAHAIDTGEHLAVQAGTGTGKSLAYLVPAIRHAVESGRTVVVSTATIALQRQLIERDLPRLAKALKKPIGREPTFAILKGRGNYLCLNKIHSGTADEPDTELFDPFELSRTGREVTRLREWSSETETGDRDDLVPGVSDRSWRQVSVTARECLGAANCSYGEDCFAEQSRRRSGKVDVVVTNHALLAINATSPANVLPEHDVVVIDEAHELVDRMTSVATDELSAASVALVARRCGKLVDEETADALLGAGEQLGELLDNAPMRQWTGLPSDATAVLVMLRDRLWQARTAIGPVRMAGADDGAAAARSAALTSLEDMHDTVVRVLGAFDEPDEAKRRDVVWASLDTSRRGAEPRPILHIAPLSVGGLLRASLFADATVILTSATLTIGGSFDALAATWGLPASGRGTDRPVTDETSPAAGSSTADVTASGKAVPSDSGSARWTGLDAGSPFDYPRSAILYVARHLPRPDRSGISSRTMDEIAELVNSAGGRTLGLFSSMRAAREAADAIRDRTDHPVLCQGDDTTSTLVRRFADDPATCLFGTLSLWQGVDVPGPSLSLVLIDRIPFPRPDDPLLTARQRAVDARGGNGFLSVAANHAALLLAQGAGRLLRSVDDRGVVAVLDSRLATAGYGGYLLASLPPMWRTTDPAVVRSALTRLTDPARSVG
ncbi:MULTISPECIES: ATP-dependent DNA helicase [unclassified Gordonia (in: high G+C Gram-positive bacteria)]|uniref:ATP-dependent DNA helicase n=1 Tax=Gordonia TaxID=2053 RepID=UPI00071E14C4|nr:MULTISPECIES: ATP-dependent DNA helicase [unclassified Gordonia (in: high G+C Gram-positive bacteria)]MCZ4538183.1 ATP-dependent DNA helicase [Gordonia terrae]KSU60646.1 ATP-dependent helicase [Gordonia sp. SGD-V-85]MBR7191979.1 ATP-dependent DNA helicase [Gordonia sp. SCSIO 19800]MCT1355827.1 ATP-dependent DNA helicase [Gordonia sp. p3-SID1431]MCX2752220.1 ATP-dependent DNA helicase [Gordonia sp. 4N]